MAADAGQDALLEIALDAAAAAGALLLRRFRATASGIGSKGSPTDMVSDADRDAQALILDLLRERRPDDGVLAEELGGSREGASGVRWIVDPLDGTTNFLYGIPAWAVSIACEDRQGGLASVVHAPALAETFAAARGRGATLDAAAVRVSAQADLAQALVATGFSYLAAERERQAHALRDVLPAIRDIRRGGSAAYDLACVACGRVDAYFETPTMPWDRAAGALLVAEAGGVCRPLAAIGVSGDGLLAAPPQLADALAALVVPALAASDGRRLPLPPTHRVH